MPHYYMFVLEIMKPLFSKQPMFANSPGEAKWEVLLWLASLDGQNYTMGSSGQRSAGWQLKLSLMSLSQLPPSKALHYGCILYFVFCILYFVFLYFLVKVG